MAKATRGYSTGSEAKADQSLTRPVQAQVAVPERLPEIEAALVELFDNLSSLRSATDEHSRRISFALRDPVPEDSCDKCGVAPDSTQLARVLRDAARYVQGINIQIRELTARCELPMAK